MIRSVLTTAVSLLVLSITYAQPSLEQKVGQMLMVGFQGTQVNANHHVVSDIVDHNIGGVIIYEYDVVSKSRPRNVESKAQLKQLIYDLKSYAKTPLFIGIDEEGGKVSRLKSKYGFLPTVSAQYLGELDDLDSTYFYGNRIAVSCEEVGVNINFAPSVDVNVNPNCPVIGGIERSFSSNPQKVIEHASQVVKAHTNNGIFCSIKHFPGHGSSQNDSHLGFTDVSETWSEQELIPFQELLKQSDDLMVMTSHVFNQNIDSVYPATLSKNTMDILRKEMKFNGLILSDDMMMRAIQNHFGLEESLEKAINAGVDVLLFSNNINTYDSSITQKVISTILNLIEQGKISEQRIDASYKRIMEYKNRL